MELDKRIIKGKKPLDCLDVDIAKKYIGQKGYFANYLCAFQDLESTDYQLKYATLKEIDNQRLVAFTDDFEGKSSYFLPDEWVKNKYRPFSIKEFEEMLATRNDDFICVRCLLCNVEKTLFYKAKYLGYALEEDENYEESGEGCLFFGHNIAGSPKHLFKNFELLSDDGRWIPFGVEIIE